MVRLPTARPQREDQMLPTGTTHLQDPRHGWTPALRHLPTSPSRRGTDSPTATPVPTTALETCPTTHQSHLPRTTNCACSEKCSAFADLLLLKMFTNLHSTRPPALNTFILIEIFTLVLPSPRGAAIPHDAIPDSPTLPEECCTRLTYNRIPPRRKVSSRPARSA